MTSLDIYTWIGFVGMACIIGAYAYQTAAVRPNPFLQHGTNLVGAGLLTVSLLVHTNWPSLVLEGFWAAIALYGIYRALKPGHGGRVMVDHTTRQSSLTPEELESEFREDYNKITAFSKIPFIGPSLFKDLPPDIDLYLARVSKGYSQRFRIEHAVSAPEKSSAEKIEETIWSNNQAVEHLSRELSIIDQKSSAMLTANSIQFAILIFALQFMPNFDYPIAYYAFTAAIIVTFFALSTSMFFSLIVSSISWTKPEHIDYSHPPYNLYFERTRRTVAHRISLLSTRAAALSIGFLVLLEIWDKVSSFLSKLP